MPARPSACEQGRSPPESVSRGQTGSEAIYPLSKKTNISNRQREPHKEIKKGMLDMKLEESL